MAREPKLKRGRPKAQEVMQQIAIRLPTSLIDDLDAMVEEMKADPLMRAERSALIRALLQDAVERRKKGGR